MNEARRTAIESQVTGWAASLHRIAEELEAAQASDERMTRLADRIGELLNQLDSISTQMALQDGPIRREYGSGEGS